MFAAELEGQTPYRLCREADCELGPLYQWRISRHFSTFAVLQIWTDRDAFCPRFCWTPKPSFPGVGMGYGLSLDDLKDLEPSSLAADASCVFDLFEIMGESAQFTWSLCNDALDMTRDGLLACSVERARGRMPRAVDDCIGKIRDYVVPYVLAASEEYG